VSSFEQEGKNLTYFPNKIESLIAISQNHESGTYYLLPLSPSTAGVFKYNNTPLL
jgi:hypothetical protein